MLFFKGVAMGIADLMPGVSGGTIALLMGVYKELVESIDSINLNNLKLLKNDGFTSFWKAINGNFLSLLFLGIITAIFTFSFAIDYLMTHHPIPLWSFFFGLLLATIIALKNSLSQWSPFNFLSMLLSAVLSFFVTQITPSNTEIGMVYLFISGFFGIIAMILPGISGAYILLILGAYSTVIGLIKDTLRGLTNFQIDLLIPTLTQLMVFVLGILTGLKIFSFVLKWLFKHKHDTTMAVLIGLMIGALHKIWPWQEKFDLVLTNSTKTILLPLSPLEYPGDPQFLSALFFFVLGMGLVFLLERNKKIIAPK